MPPDDSERSPGAPGTLSAQEAARLLGIHARTVRRAIGSGELMATKQRGSCHIKRSTCCGPSLPTTVSDREECPEVPGNAFTKGRGRQTHLSGNGDTTHNDAPVCLTGRGCYCSTMRPDRPSLTRFAWLSILAAVLTIGLKTGAYLLTGSVGLLSDALESLVNLVAAIAALIALSIAEKAPDEEHAFGHGKAEYFASGLEGALVFVAAGGIVASPADRDLQIVLLAEGQSSGDVVRVDAAGDRGRLADDQQVEAEAGAVVFAVALYEHVAGQRVAELGELVLGHRY